MHALKKNGWVTALCCIAMLTACSRSYSGAPTSEWRTSKTYGEVIDDLDFAITERNFRITGRNTIGRGIQARGHENFPNAEVVHFCNLENARKVMEIDPGFIAQMPCRITVHEAGEDVVITALLLPLSHPDPRMNAFSRELNATIEEIAEFAATDFWLDSGSN